MGDNPLRAWAEEVATMVRNAGSNSASVSRYYRLVAGREGVTGDDLKLYRKIADPRNTLAIKESDNI